MKQQAASGLAGDLLELRIDRLGSEGDGVASDRHAAQHVRYALPGETVLCRPLGRNRAQAEQVLVPSPVRAIPPCSLFGRCGGCVLQHMDTAAMLTWKISQVGDALRSAGFVLPDRITSCQSPPRTRRRMDLAIRRERGQEGVTVGLHVRGSDQVIGLSECHVLAPRLFALIGDLRPTLSRLQGLRRTGSMIVNLLESGPDILLSTDGPILPRDRLILAEAAAAFGIPRIAWVPEVGDAAPETLCSLVPALHRFGDVPVAPPPGAFLQATLEGEASIVEAVLASLPARMLRSARLVELYAGCGTISFALADRSRVDAYEGDAASVACLRSAGATRRIQVHQRDLNRQPVMARELADATAVVLDPPHAGAGAQARELAVSGVPNVIYVSCSPAALAADGRLLSGAGYRLERVTVIDQFLWSARAESVCLFTRPVVTRRGPMPRPPR